MKEIKLYTENDLTKKERKVQRELVAKVEKRKTQVKVGYRVLRINDRFFKGGKRIRKDEFLEQAKVHESLNN